MGAVEGAGLYKQSSPFFGLLLSFSYGGAVDFLLPGNLIAPLISCPLLSLDRLSSSSASSPQVS